MLFLLWTDMILMEANYGSLDQTIGEAWYSLNDLPPNEVVTKSFFFPKDGVIFFTLVSSIFFEYKFSFSRGFCWVYTRNSILSKCNIQENIVHVLIWSLCTPILYLKLLLNNFHWIHENMPPNIGETIVYDFNLIIVFLLIAPQCY